MSAMPEMLRGHEFEALKSRFENQTELLHRMTLIDLQVFSGYISLQLALGAWLATHERDLIGLVPRIGVMLIDLVLMVIAGALLYNNHKRRAEVVAIVRNCNEALGYETEGVFLDGRTLNVPTKFRPWGGLFFVGIVSAFAGVGLVVFGSASLACSAMIH